RGRVGLCRLVFRGVRTGGGFAVVGGGGGSPPPSPGGASAFWRWRLGFLEEELWWIWDCSFGRKLER
ncbi:hypothetical protein MIMGU_mgv1a0149361mg, partial [Erythranthe guttata]